MKKFYHKKEEFPLCGAVCEEFLKYLEELDTTENIHTCPYLRELLEDVSLIWETAKAEKYSQGDLICIKRYEKTLNPLCGIESKLSLNENGELELICLDKEIKFTVKLLSAEPNKPKIANQNLFK